MPKRILDNHPTKEKLDALWAFADRLGIRIDFMGCRTLVTDVQADQVYVLSDLQKEAITSWPAETEYKITTVE